MSSLIGTAIPTNNHGKLPQNYLNVSEVSSFSIIAQPFLFQKNLFPKVLFLKKMYFLKKIYFNRNTNA